MSMIKSFSFRSRALVIAGLIGLSASTLAAQPASAFSLGGFGAISHMAFGHGGGGGGGFARGLIRQAIGTAVREARRSSGPRFVRPVHYYAGVRHVRVRAVYFRPRLLVRRLFIVRRVRFLY